MRSSYSTPSAFIAATASPRALFCWAARIWRGSSSVDSTTDTMSRAYDGDSGSSSSNAASANVDSGWLSAKSCWRSTVSRTMRPVGVGLVELLDDAAVQQRAVDRDGPPDVPQLLLARLVVVLQQMPHRLEGVAGPGDHRQQHRVRHAEAGGQRLRIGGDQLLEGVLRPADEALGRLLAHHLAALLRVVAGLGERLLVLDDVLGRLRDDEARRVEARAAGAARDLVELAGAQRAHPSAVVLGQRGEQHRADGHVDADAERVRAADDLQQTGLGELLHQPPVLGQHAGVVHADAVPYVTGEVLAELGGEAEVADQLGDLVLLLARAHVDAHQRLRPLDGLRLGEVHDVDRGLLGGQQFGEGLGQRREHVLVGQRDGPGRRADHGRGPAGAPGQVLLEHRDVAERRRHQDELRLRQFQDRDLPGPAAVAPRRRSGTRP